MKRWFTAVILLILTLSASSGTRDDIQRLEAQMASLFDQVRSIENHQRELQKSLDELAARLDALGRASQTADLREDMESLKVRMEVLGSKLEEVRTIPAAPAQAERLDLEVLQPEAEATAASDEALDNYRLALEDFNRRRYDLAASQFREFLEQAPGDAKAGNAQYWIGECFYGQERYEEALSEFQAVMGNYQASPKVAAARLKVGFCLLALGRKAEGTGQLESLIRDLPDSEEAQRARERLSSMTF
jgi:tol-pal system protein YbgF